MYFYAAQVACVSLCLMSLLIGHVEASLLFGMVGGLVYRQSIQQQQLDYLLYTDDIKQLTRANAQALTSARPVERVKGL